MMNYGYKVLMHADGGNGIIATMFAIVLLIDAILLGVLLWNKINK